jgi:hypothetical protein
MQARRLFAWRNCAAKPIHHRVAKNLNISNADPRRQPRSDGVLDFKAQIRKGSCDEWEGLAGAAVSFSRGSRHCRRERMRTSTCLSAAMVILAALPLTAPAQACKARPHSTSLCTVIPTSVEVRDEPNGRVTSDATGVVRVCRAIQGWAVGAYRGALHRIYGLDRPSEPCVCGRVRQRARAREAVTPVLRDSRSPRVHGERAGQAEFRLLRPPCGTSKRTPCASGNSFEKLIVLVARRI